MLIKMIKTTLPLIMALCLAAPLATGLALAAGSQKQQCDRAIWDCVEKAKRLTCNRNEMYMCQQSRYEGKFCNQSLCGGPHKWWADPGGTLARRCPSKGQVVSAASVEAAIKRARNDMYQNCVKYHVFLLPNAGPNHPWNQYKEAGMNQGNCHAWADAFAKCLREKYKRNPLK